MFGVWGSPARFLNRHLEIRDNSGAFGIRSLFNPLKNTKLHEYHVLFGQKNLKIIKFKELQMTPIFTV